MAAPAEIERLASEFKWKLCNGYRGPCCACCCPFGSRRHCGATRRLCHCCDPTPTTTTSTTMSQVALVGAPCGQLALSLGVGSVACRSTRCSLESDAETETETETETAASVASRRQQKLAAPPMSLSDDISPTTTATGMTSELERTDGFGLGVGSLARQRNAQHPGAPKGFRESWAEVGVAKEEEEASSLCCNRSSNSGDDDCDFSSKLDRFCNTDSSPCDRRPAASWRPEAAKTKTKANSSRKPNKRPLGAASRISIRRGGAQFARPETRPRVAAESRLASANPQAQVAKSPASCLSPSASSSAARKSEEASNKSPIRGEEFKKRSQWEEGKNFPAASLMSPPLPLVTLARTWWLLLLLLLVTRNCDQRHGQASAKMMLAADDSTIYVKVGILLEESDHEHANMFIRTIKMINERRDETIGRLLQPRGFNASPLDRPTRAPVREARSPPAKEVSRSPEVGAYISSYGRDVGATSGSALGGQFSASVSSGGGGAGDGFDVAANNFTWKQQLRNDRVARSTNNNRSSQFNVKLEPVIEFLRDPHSSFEADNKVCQLIESGVRVIFGPARGASIAHVQSICDNLEIPYFELRPHLGSMSAPLGQQVVRRATSGGGESSSGDSRSPVTRAESAQPTNDNNNSNNNNNNNNNNNYNDLQKVGLSLNLHPPAHQLNCAYIDLIYALNWTSFAIVYEDDSSMIKLQDLLRESSGSWTSKWRIKLFRHEPASKTVGQHQSASISGSGSAQSSNGLADSVAADHLGSSVQEKSAVRNTSDLLMDYDSKTIAPAAKHKRQPTFRDVFWRVKSSGEKNILLDVSNENLYEALKHAQQVGLMTEEFSYLITSLDMHMIDMEDFKYSRTKITAFSMLQVAKSQRGGDLPTGRMSSSAKQSSSSNWSSDQLDGRGGGDAGDHLFDEKYLERLGVHRPDASGSGRSTSGGGRAAGGSGASRRQGKQISSKQRQFVAPSQLDDSIPNASDLLTENDLARREMLQSSPASMGLLPTVDRNNEQKLFEFFIEQQERNTSHVRLSTSSATLHDSLVLYLLGLYELDPSGDMLSRQASNEDTPVGSTTGSGPFNQEPVACALSSRPWPHGSSLVNYMRQISFTGLSGRINFDPNGLRTDFRLNVMGLAPNIKQIKVGEWSSAERESYYWGSRPPTSAPQANHSAQDSAQKQAANPPTENPTLTAGSSYDELSSQYESELKRYTKMLADGVDVTVPYTKSASKSGSLKVNEIIFDRLYKEPADQVDTLVVTSKLSQPYFMLKETPNRLEGNDQFEGYAVDLIHELSKLVNFRYKWQLAADGKYGSKELLPNGTIVWNGMIGEIVRGKADLAIVDLTITAQREEAVDFTLPFMNTGISILFKKPTTKVTTLFSFLSPFSSDVWAYVLAAYCGISAILFLVGHLSPYEWANPHPCRHIGEDDETVLKNQFSLLNSFWFTIGSLMQQGSDLTPRSMSTRTIAGIWYFFTLIMISSYTANLAAFLTVEKVVYPIENVRDLSQQQEIKYGCVESGSTCTFFHDSQIDTYKRIDETMRKYHTYVRSNDEGQKRVGEGKFAFFMESTTIEYIIERNCNLTQIGGLIDSKGYGLATSKKSRLKRPYRTLLNEGILHLQETGMLHVLKNRWWKERRGGGTCTDDGKGGGVTELSLANVGGVFVVLLGGLGISFLVAIAEFMWRARRSGSSRDRMCEEMMSDLKFALACKSSTKPIARSNSRSRSSCRLNQQQSLISAYEDLDPTMLLRPHLANRHRLQASALSLQHNNQFDKLTAANFGNHIQANHLVYPEDQTTNDQHQRHQPANSTKDCDPILMHAMITLLMQQQQEQQEQMEQRRALQYQQQQSIGNFTYHTSGDLVAPTPATDQQPESPLFAGPRSKSRQATNVAARSYHNHQQLNSRSRSQQNLTSYETNQQQSSTEQEEYSNDDHNQRQLFQGHHQASGQMQQQNGTAHWPAGGLSRSEAGVRRLLFAQQLVDSTTDDSPIGTSKQQQQQHPQRY